MSGPRASGRVINRTYSPGAWWAEIGEHRVVTLGPCLALRIVGGRIGTRHAAAVDARLWRKINGEWVRTNAGFKVVAAELDRVIEAMQQVRGELEQLQVG